jgi:NADH-quinone oxidoreductase subunit M
MLWSTQRVFFNRLTNPLNEGIGDLSLRELAVIGPLIAAMIWVGLYPAPLLKRTESAARSYVEMVEPALPKAALPDPGARP